MMTSLLMFSGLLMASTPDLPAFSPSDSTAVSAEAAMVEGLIDRYAQQSESVFIGEVLSISHINNQPIQGSRAIFNVYEQLQGDTPGIVDVRVPPVGDYIDGDPFPAPVTISPGDTMVVFIDKDGNAVAHNAMFLIRGGFAWRSKREEVFFNPFLDRDWSNSIDPSADYVLISVAQIRNQVQAQPPEGFAQQRTRRANR